MNLEMNNDPQVFEDIHSTVQQQKICVLLMHEHDLDSQEPKCIRYGMTAGMTLFGYPELICFFPNDDAAQLYGQLISNIVDHIKKERKQSLPNGWRDEQHMFAQTALEIRDLTAAQVIEYTGPVFEYMANQKHPAPRYQQIVVPDREGRLPDHPDFERAYMEEWGQPLLFESTPVLQ